MKTFLHFSIAVFFLLITNLGFAQMIYVPSSGTFTANSFPTVIHSINIDDALSAPINIGFTFNFQCQPYTQIKVSSNGWLGLGTVASGSLNVNDLDNSNGYPTIAPLWDDIKTNSASSSVNYKLTGSAPNRILTVEWLNMKWDYNATAAVISFQAKLYETTDKIEFVYRQEAGTVNSASASIGISYGTTGNWYSLDGTGPAANAIFGTEYWQLNTKPATGQVYTWTPNVSIMSFVSSTVAQSTTANASKCGLDQNIIQLQVVTTGICNPISVSQLQFNMNGSSIPGTNTIDVSKIHIYYTKTNAYFSPTNEFVVGGIVPATGTITANGSQTLMPGTNYFWIAYDIHSTSAVVGHLLDAQCTQITVGGTPQTPSTTNPAGQRAISNCMVAPGGVSDGLAFWVKSNLGTSSTTDGALLSAWNDQSGFARHATQATSANQPTFLDNSASNLNYYPTVDFDDAAQAAANGDFMDILSNNILPANNDPYVVYSLIIPSTGNTTAPGKFLFSGSGINQFVAFDVRSSGTINDSWDLNDLLVNSVWTPSEILLNTFNYDFNTRTMYKGGSVIGTLNGNNRQSTNLTSALACQTCVNPHIEFYDGKIVEIITYPNTSHSIFMKNKIESYLSVKYGTTLSHNYSSSINDTVWNMATNPSYNLNVIAVGRDDNSALYHRQSKSTMPSPDILILSVGPSIQVNQANNTGSFSAGDHSFFFSGQNGGSPTFAASAEEPASVTARLGREWLSQKTNFTNADLTLTFDLSGAGAFVQGDVRLMVDADGDFTNATVLSTAVVSYSWVGTTLTAVLDASNFTSTPYYTLAIRNTVAPVTFLNINAYPIDAKVQVDWSTASELNNKLFVVERSKDGASFEEIQKVNGAGNSSVILMYNSFDLEPLPGLSYYRIKQVDFDGKISYSKIVEVEIGVHFQVFPNPVSLKEISSLKIVGIEDSEEVLITLFDVNGKELFSNTIVTANGGSTTIGFDNQMNINPGLYLLTATSNRKTYELKVIVK